MLQKPLQTGSRRATLAGDKIKKNPDFVTQGQLSTALQNTGALNSPPLTGEIPYNNVAVLADTAIAVTVDAGATYQIDAVIPFRAATSALQVALAGTATAVTFSGVWTSYNYAGALDQTLAVAALGTAFPCGVTNQEGNARFIGHIHVLAGGTLVIQGAQASASATVTSILAGSRLTATRLIAPYLNGHIDSTLGNPNSPTIQPVAISDQTLGVPAAAGDDFIYLSGGNLRRADSSTVIGVVPDGDKGDILVSGGGLIWTLESGYLPVSGINSIFRIGSTEYQGIAANSSIILDNGYWNGANFVHRATGAMAGMHMNGDNILFMTYASAVAGTLRAYSPALSPLILSPSGATFNLGASTVDEAYNAVTWDGSLSVPTKNALRDFFITLGTMAFQNANAVAITGGTIIHAADANDSDIRLGGLELQGASALSAMLMLNMFWDGGFFERRTTGAASGIHFDGENIRFMAYASAVAGTDIAYTPATPFSIGPTSAAFNVDVTVPYEVYDATAWNGSNEAPTKDAIRDKFEALPTLASGTYTPTVSSNVNLAANPTMTLAQYMRVGSVVTVSGKFTADAVAAGTASFQIDPPIASNFGDSSDTGGTACTATTTETAAAIACDKTTNLIEVSWIATDLTSQDWHYSYTYRII